MALSALEHGWLELRPRRRQLRTPIFLAGVIGAVVAAMSMGASEFLSDEARSHSAQFSIAPAAWMLLASLIAAALPVVPFGFLALNTARIVSLCLMSTSLTCLGLGRARIQSEHPLPTVAETLGVAAVATVLGVLVGLLIG